jgi:glycosyltransferase involved in cell wall biosynthesis
MKALAEAVSGLLNDEERRGRIAKAASEDVRSRFSLERMVEATEKIYVEVTGKKGKY